MSKSPVVLECCRITEHTAEFGRLQVFTRLIIWSFLGGLGTIIVGRLIRYPASRLCQTGRRGGSEGGRFLDHTPVCSVWLIYNQSCARRPLTRRAFISRCRVGCQAPGGRHIVTLWPRGVWKGAIPRADDRLEYILFYAIHDGGSIFPLTWVLNVRRNAILVSKNDLVYLGHGTNHRHAINILCML